MPAEPTAQRPALGDQPDLRDDPRAAPDEAGRDGSQPTRPPRHWPDQLIGASTIAAWICLALILAGLAVGSVPVRTPIVQDCGTPLAFVLTGRVDRFLDPNNPPRGVTAKEAEAANKRPCRKRVAPRMVRSAELLLGGLVAGLAGVVMLLVGRTVRRRDLLLRWGSGTSPSGTWGTSPMASAPRSRDGDHHEPDPGELPDTRDID